MKIHILVLSTIVLSHICCKHVNHNITECVDMTICEKSLEEAKKNGVQQKFCAYYFFERDTNSLSKENFVKYLAQQGRKNDSLIYWLEKLDFEITFRHSPEAVIGLAKLNGLKCLVKKDGCSIPDSIIYLFYQPTKECKSIVEKTEKDVTPFLNESKYGFTSDSPFPYGKLNHQIDIVRNDFFFEILFKMDELFNEDEIEKRNSKKVTEFICYKNHGKRFEDEWSCEVMSSEHKSQEKLSIAKKMFSEYLDSSKLVRLFPLDSILIPISYYEKDQTIKFSTKDK